MMKTHKLFACLVAALGIALVATSCTPKKTSATGYQERGLRDGFIVETRPSPNERCAYTTETNKFDIDNVEVTFYYGVRQMTEKKRSCDSFDICFYSDKELYLVKHVDEEFYSEKYSVSYESEYIFNYSEKIKIPAEVFSGNGGFIYFRLYGNVTDYIWTDNKYETKTEYTYFNSASLYYRKYGNTVYLSEDYFDSM